MLFFYVPFPSIFGRFFGITKHYLANSTTVLQDKLPGSVSLTDITNVINVVMI